MSNDQAYSKAEIVAAQDRLPAKGIFCNKCGSFIPQFKDLTSEDHERLVALINGNQRMQAMVEIRKITGCNISWAKIWAFHPHGPEDNPTINLAPCPYCAQPLRTANAKQCRHCKKDWHDADNIISLK